MEVCHACQEICRNSCPALNCDFIVNENLVAEYSRLSNQERYPTYLRALEGRSNGQGSGHNLSAQQYGRRDVLRDTQLPKPRRKGKPVPSPIDFEGTA